jgi:replicative DNA helicase
MAENLLCNADAEKSVLGSILIDPAAMHRAGDLVGVEDFWLEQHRWIFGAMQKAHATGLAVDNVSVAAMLEEQGKRRLMDATAKIARAAHNPDAELDAVFDQARRLIDSIAPLRLGEAVLGWRESLEIWLGGQGEREQEAKAERKGDAAGRVRFPWKALQRRVRWLRPGMMAVIGAESGVGKTMFLECCAEAWAKEGRQVAFFHFELSHQVMLDRRAVRQSGLSMAELEDGECDDPRLHAALDRLSKWPGGVTYAHCPGWTMTRVASTARQLAAKGQADVVLVDYLQKARLVSRGGLTPAQVRGQQVETLKVLAEELAIPVLLATQLNRAAWGQARKTRHTIRDTGEADEKANVVILLDREILAEDAKSETGRVVARAGELSPVVKVRTDKNTLGNTGDDTLIMNPARFRILDQAPRGDSED